MHSNAETRPGVTGGSQEDRRGSRSKTSMPEGQPVRATPEWPPIAIPGRPGWRRHCIDGRQVDLPEERDGQ